MEDRELLEMAAKAAGVYFAFYNNDGSMYTRNHGSAWNPLDDGGDALALAVKLQTAIDYFFKEGVAYVYVQVFGKSHVEIPLGNDHEAATRRAIVQVAANIGKAMP